MPRLLDLFCGAGGAAMGYSRAGFSEIVGVDIKPQPRYPFAFVQGDALEYVKAHGHEFDAIHASPPCQAYSSVSRINGAQNRHFDLIPATRLALRTIGAPYVIENVPGAPLKAPCLMLCGTMFGRKIARANGAIEYLRRHRYFETSHLFMGPSCDHGIGARAVGVYGGGSMGKRHNMALASEARALMDMDGSLDDCTQAIPPAYTEFIGKQLLAVLV